MADDEVRIFQAHLLFATPHRTGVFLPDCDWQPTQRIRHIVRIGATLSRSSLIVHAAREG
jgi:hypothetical protein